MCCDARAEVLRRVDGARVVDSGSFVVHADIGCAAEGKTLLETVTC